MIHINALKKMIADNSVELIDVREPDEHALIHLEQAKLVPVDELEARVDEIDWKKQVVLFCRTGWRSNRAVQALDRLGKQASSLDGGIQVCFDDEKLPGLIVKADQKTIQDYFK